MSLATSSANEHAAADAAARKEKAVEFPSSLGDSAAFLSGRHGQYPTTVICHVLLATDGEDRIQPCPETLEAQGLRP